MAPCPDRLVSTGLLALPGRAGAMALAAAGRLAAGDDRGEVGIWEADGTRAASGRMRGAVVGADIDPAGSRALFTCADGEVLVVVPGSPVQRVRGRPGDRAVLASPGPGWYSIAPATGRVDVCEPHGRARGFVVPGPLHAVAGVPRTGGIVVATREGTVGRFTAAGDLTWGGDYRRYTGGVAADPLGAIVVVCFLAHGAEVLDAVTGARLGLLDVGRAIDCAAISSGRIALGCTDGTIVLFDRAGQVLAEGRARAKVSAIGLSEAGAIFALLGDGTVQPFTVESALAPGASGATPGAGRAADWRLPIAAERSAHTALVAISDSGDVVACAAERRRVVTVDSGGTVLEAAAHEGTVLALRADADGTTWAATTREILRVAAGANLVVRRFQSELRLAAWSGDGLVLAAADEMGALRVHLRDAESDFGEMILPSGGIDTVVAAGHGGAARSRCGPIALIGPCGPCFADLGTRPAPARLEAALDAGPVVVAGMELVALGWDGRPRWSCPLPGVPEAVRAVGPARLLVVLRDRLVLLSEDGRPEGRPWSRPEGRLLAVAGGPAVAAAWADGRRLVVTRGADVLLDVTLEAPIASAALSGLGAVAAVVLSGRLAAIRVTAPAPGGTGTGRAGVGRGNPELVRIASHP